VRAENSTPFLRQAEWSYTMKHEVRPDCEPMDNEDTVTLSPPATAPRKPRGAASDRDTLHIYTVALQPPRRGSSPERRLRLRNHLCGGDASTNAGILARDPHFWDYLHQINLIAYEDEIDTRRARQFINRACGVHGRHEFEHCADAALRYFTVIEEPFLDWLLAGDNI
jgi:hypothetical protein